MPYPTVNPAFKLDHLPRARSIDDVIANFDTIIDWAIQAGNGIGYFATVYKRATVVIKQKVEAGGYFEDDERMTRFDIVFAQRYFDALNAYFHPEDYEAPTHAWQWSFDGHEYDSPEPIMLQHMLSAVNAHVNLDLGIAAWLAAGGEPLDDLEFDFDQVNVLLAEEVAVYLKTLSTLSPRVGLIRRALLCEDRALGHVLRIFRNLAWAFSHQLAASPQRRREHVGVHDAWAGVLGSYYLHLNDSLSSLTSWIGEKESVDVAHNLRVLDGRV